MVEQEQRVHRCGRRRPKACTTRRNEHDACGLGFIAHIKGRKSHAIIRHGLAILENLTHRGATGADPLQGDGAGILIQLPDAFLRRACGKLGITLPAIGQYGVGMVFLPQEPASRMACEQEIERAIVAEGQVLLGWRDVPDQQRGDCPSAPRRSSRSSARCSSDAARATSTRTRWSASCT